MSTHRLLKHNFSLRSFNTFGIEANASTYLEVQTVEDLFHVYHDVALMSLPRLIIGGGSNLLLTDHFSGLVLKMMMKGMNIEKEDEDYVYVRAAAGEKWQDLISWTLQNNWGGLENLSWIPGTVGAAPVQNIGAYGTELQDCFFSLKAFDFKEGIIIDLNKQECHFEYRNSIFKKLLRDRVVIFEVTFALPKFWKPNTSYAEVEKALALQKIAHPSPAQISEIIIDIRKKKLPDPAIIGNAGSFFKNPVVTKEEFFALKRVFIHLPAYEQADGHYRIAAGWLIDQCGWKGRRIGNVGVCETQALVLVNYGNASGQEIVALAKSIQADVFDKFAIGLEPEPVFI